MRRGVQESVLGLASLILAGCAGESGEQEGRFAHSDRTELLARLQLGQPVLDCREACLAAWKRIQPSVAQLDAAARWDDLAVLVIRTGYQDDLSLYYLGKAAEGRKFYAAAVDYYRQSMRLSGTSTSCAYLSRLCGGVTLPSSAAERLAAAERLSAQPKARPRRPASASRPPAAEPIGSETPPPAADPAQLAPASPATLPPRLGTAGNSDPASVYDYIEPPPAAR